MSIEQRKGRSTASRIWRLVASLRTGTLPEIFTRSVLDADMAGENRAQYEFTDCDYHFLVRHCTGVNAAHITCYPSHQWMFACSQCFAVGPLQDAVTANLHCRQEHGLF